MGLSAEQASGWGWTAAVHPDDLNSLTAAWQRIMASEPPSEAEMRLCRFDGEIDRFYSVRRHAFSPSNKSTAKR